MGRTRTGEGGGDGEPVVELRGVVKRFPGVLAVDGVDLSIRVGEVHVVAGENGCLLYTSPSPRDRS